jgi:hypothetical protein
VYGQSTSERKEAPGRVAASKFTELIQDGANSTLVEHGGNAHGRRKLLRGSNGAASLATDVARGKRPSPPWER